MLTDAEVTVFGADETNGLGALLFRHPPGTFALSPASHMALAAIFANHERLRGIGIDWGCGAGCLAVAAARASAVEQVVAIDINPANVAATRLNAAENNVAEKVIASVGDSYRAFERDGIAAMSRAHGNASFIVSNPPASDGDDGFGFRRVVVRGAAEFLRPGGLLFLSVSSQYGQERIDRLVDCARGIVYGGLLATSPPVPFDLYRGDLHECLLTYATTEARGETAYEFLAHDAVSHMTATEALRQFNEDGTSPLSRWQVHLFRRAE